MQGPRWYCAHSLDCVLLTEQNDGEKLANAHAYFAQLGRLRLQSCLVVGHILIDFIISTCHFPLKNGHELGCHSLYWSMNSELSVTYYIRSVGMNL